MKTQQKDQKIKVKKYPKKQSKKKKQSMTNKEEILKKKVKEKLWRFNI